MATRTVDLGCTFRFSATMPTASVFMVEARSDDLVSVHDAQWSSTPEVESHTYTDAFGNTCRRLVMPVGVTTFTYSAVAEVPDAIDWADEQAPETPMAELPSDVLVYTLPSRFCESDVLSGQAWKLFSGTPRGHARVQAICSWVYNYLTYTTGSTVSTNTAADAFLRGVGVCRDFAHLMIAMCRAMNIPARYTFGYLPDMDFERNPAPMDFHAWVEVWLGGRWVTFDPRHDARRKGRVVVAHGRDAADTAMVTTYGGPWMQLMTVTCDERPTGTAGLPISGQPL